MNKKVDDKWLKDLRERMEDYSEPLPEGLWEELEGDLAGPKVIPFWRRWPAVAAAVALVLVVSSLALSQWFAPRFEGEVMQVAQRQAAQLEDTQLEAAQLEDTQLEAAQLEAAHSKGENKQDVSREADLRKDSPETALLAQAEETASEVEVMKVSSDVDAKREEAQERAYPAYPTATRAGTARSTSANYHSTFKRNSRIGQIELGIHTGGAPYGASKEYAGMGRLLAERPAHSQVPVYMDNVASKLSPYDQVLFSNRNQNTYTEVNHHMPITVVASVKWHFAEDWAFESGISYTFMESDLHTGAQLYWEDTQQLHYVGIPLKIHRNIWQNAMVGLYASAGGMLEKCVSGSVESKYVTQQNEQVRESHSVDVHPFQGSLSAALGAQVNFLKKLSLFVEPGVAYFFDDNSHLITIRKEHPFNFNLQFGLRLNLNR